MDFDTYQTEARKTAIYKGKDTALGIYYCALGLGEAGEIQGKVKKIIRDDDEKITQSRRHDIIKEMGDNLWYLANLAEELGTSLNRIAIENIEKLKSRQERNMLKGDGDNR